MLHSVTFIIKQVPLFELSLLLKNYIHEKQMFQLNEIGNYLQK
jgi:hypothetical protein